MAGRRGETGADWLLDRRRNNTTTPPGDGDCVDTLDRPCSCCDGSSDWPAFFRPLGLCCDLSSAVMGTVSSRRERDDGCKGREEEGKEDDEEVEREDDDEREREREIDNDDGLIER